MNRMEKLRLSASHKYGCCFKQGLFVRLYEETLFWFVTHVKPLKPMLERVKGGEPVVYGGLPMASFGKLLEEGHVIAETTDTGWQWRYAEQAQGKDEEYSGFSVWKEAILSATVIPMQATQNSYSRKGGNPEKTLGACLRRHGGEEVRMTIERGVTAHTHYE